MALIYLLVPSSELAYEGKEPINKYLAALMLALLGFVALTAAHFIRKRKKNSAAVFIILSILSVPIAELAFYYSSTPTGLMDRLSYAISIIPIAYLLISKEVKAVLVK